MGGRARALLGFGAFGAFWGAWGALLPVLQRHARVTDGELGVALVLIGIGALISLRPVGSLADRHPRAALPLGLALLGISTVGPTIARGPLALQRASAKNLVGDGAALAAIGSAVAAQAPSVSIAMAGIAVAGLGTSVCAPTLIALAARATPHRPGAATSTVITLAYLGFVLSPAAVGLLAQATTLRTALTAIAAGALSLALASRTLTRITPAPAATAR